MSPGIEKAARVLSVASLHIYPVKALKGVAVLAAPVEPWGLAGDRRWMVVDPTGRFLTQRQHPHLALLAAQVVPGGLQLRAPDGAVLHVATPAPAAARVATVVWGDAVTAAVADAAADAWLGTVLGVPCRLVYMADPAVARPVDPDFGEAGDRVSFADGFPLLVTADASLHDLNRRLPAPVPMSRFRPNVVVAGGNAWDEDRWRRLRIGAVVFRVVKDCARCAVTTVDQDTGERAPDTEPLRTLATFRRKAGGRIIVGQNLVPEDAGTIEVGDSVEVMEAS